MRPPLILALLVALSGCLTDPEPASTPEPDTGADDAPDQATPTLPSGWTWDGLLQGKSCIPNDIGHCLVVYHPTSPSGDYHRIETGWTDANATITLDLTWDPATPEQETLDLVLVAIPDCFPDACYRGRTIYGEKVTSPTHLEIPVAMKPGENRLYVQVNYVYPGQDPVRTFTFLDQPFHMEAQVTT